MRPLNGYVATATLAMLGVGTLLMPTVSLGEGNDSAGLIDNRASGTLDASIGSRWRLVTDRVMGGRSSGDLRVDTHRGHACLRLTGDVSTANNGGFVQAVLSLAAGQGFDASAYTGLRLTVAGNGEEYNLHLRTTDLSSPWQSYRASFVAKSQWREIRIPFAQLEPYRTGSAFQPDRLERVGLVAIGRAFAADLCLADLRFYMGSDD